MFSFSQLSAVSDSAQDIANLRICIEQLLCERFHHLQNLVDKQFCKENELIGKAIESFNLRLRESAVDQQRASNDALKRFILCKLKKTEENLEGFICHKLNCLGASIIEQLDNLACDLQVALAKTDLLDQNIDCFSQDLLEFLTVINGVSSVYNPLYLNLDGFIDDAQSCVNAALLDTCSDIFI